MFPTVRRSIAADGPELVRVINLAYRVEDFFINGDRTNEGDLRGRLTNPDAAFLVIDNEPGTALAAGVYVEIRGPRGYFGMLSVDPAHQKRGLGTLLANAAEDYCRAAGCGWLDIEVVNLREELPAFYARLGFQPGATALFPDPHKLRRHAHLVHMCKAIGPKAVP